MVKMELVLGLSPQLCVQDEDMHFSYVVVKTIMKSNNILELLPQSTSGVTWPPP